MDNEKSLDDLKIIAALLHDVHSSHGVVFNNHSLKLTLQKVRSRLAREGISFLTKTLPKLGKAFDKALSGSTPLNATEHGFKSMPGTNLPIFMGEFFSRVLQPNGELLHDPCVQSVRVLRQVLYLYYKYELPYTDEQEQLVLDRFERTERELTDVETTLRVLTRPVDPDVTTSYPSSAWKFTNQAKTQEEVVRKAKVLLAKLFAFFDPYDIVPRHGPGAVATKQQLWSKYAWTNVSAKITSVYPLDAYFYASLGHVCDRADSFNGITEEDLPARVLLVPKDSRGPRLISCEPVDYQWIQQGLSKAIVELVENTELTKSNVFFTDQGPNRCGALLGSEHGRYSTLDLNEASDRVSLELVRLLFPEHIYTCLEATRSSATELPDGRILKLRKFAPMGSSLCFPIMALTIWAILTAAAPDKDTSDSILVYGDDVIVPTAYAANAIEQLESFGLKINRDKSCTGGLFRESCGMDAFAGTCVTPVRLRTVWSSKPSPEVYTSWIAYANSFYDRRYYSLYNLVVEALVQVYGPIPDDSMHLACPRLRVVTEAQRPKKSRTNYYLQKRQWYVWDVRSPAVNREIDGWSMLLRYFTEGSKAITDSRAVRNSRHDVIVDHEVTPFSVRSYTRRRASMLVRRWR